MKYFPRYIFITLAMVVWLYIPASFADPGIASQATDANIKLLELLREHGDEVKLKEARERICPHDFTAQEIDGIAPYEDRNRQTLCELCDESIKYQKTFVRHKAQYLKNVSLKVKSCLCIQAYQDDMDPIEMKSFPPKIKTGKSECELLKYHVGCNAFIDDVSPTHIFCPLECVDFSK